MGVLSMGLDHCMSILHMPWILTETAISPGWLGKFKSKYLNVYMQELIYPMGSKSDPKLLNKVNVFVLCHFWHSTKTLMLFADRQNVLCQNNYKKFQKGQKLQKNYLVWIILILMKIFWHSILSYIYVLIASEFLCYVIFLHSTKTINTLEMYCELN